MERVQKNAFRIILGNNYKSYSESLRALTFDTLVERREKLSLKFALNCTENIRTKKSFPLRKKKHIQKTRKLNKYEVTFCNKDRLGRSAVPYLQNLLNNYEIKICKQEKIKNST